MGQILRCGDFLLATGGPAGCLLHCPPSSLPLALAVNPLETHKCGTEFRGCIELRMDGLAQMLDAAPDAWGRRVIESPESTRE